MNFILFVLICVVSYFAVDIFIEKELLKKFNNYLNKKNEKYYEELLKYYEKNKKIKLKEKLNYFRKINITIDRCGFKRSIIMNPITIILLGFLCVVVAYNLAFEFFKIILLSFIISLPLFYLPIDYEAEKIAKKHLSGEKVRGDISNLARKFEVSRQFAHQRVEMAKEKLKNM